VTPIETFLLDIDRGWNLDSAARIPLQILGSSALMLQADYQRGTKDSDVLETAQLTSDTKTRLLELAGKGSSLHQRHKLYIEFVPNGLPFLPQIPDWLPLRVSIRLSSISKSAC
jgi:hypothetical protein